MIKAAAVSLALIALFVWLFDPFTVQWGVDFLWLASIAVWSIAVWRQRTPSGGAVAPRRAVPLLLLLGVFCALWLPFYDDWRWAFTGDSLAWFDVPYNAGRNGMHQSLLSVRGVDENFTYLHSVGPHALMMLIEPTMFWHRVGKLLESLAALAAIYLFFMLTIGRVWALILTFAVATNYVWIWFSYVSYGHVISFVFSFLSLSAAVQAWRAPDNRVWWLAAGLIGGLSLFFAQTAWAEVAAVGLVLGVLALRRRRIDLLAIYGVSFVLVGLPFALQWADVSAMFTRNAGEQGAVDSFYLRRIFGEILYLPIDSGMLDLGVYGAFLRPPMAWLYVVGAGIAALGVWPSLRRALCIPAIAPVVLAIFLFDAVLMTLTNNAYGNVSTKRAYHLIPYYLFLALLPFMALQQRARGRLSRGAWALTAAALAAYVVGNAELIVTPPKGMYGFTVFDGLIELRQRYPEHAVALFTSRGAEFANAVLGPESVVAREYKIRDTVVLEPRIDAAGLADACASQALMCYEPEFDEEAFNDMVAPYGAGMTALQTYTSREVACFWPLPSCPSPVAGDGHGGG